MAENSKNTSEASVPVRELSEPKLDEVKSVEFEFVREPAQFAPPRNGRPNKLSVRLFIVLCQRIETGESVLDACFELGVSYKTVWVHVNKRPAYSRRYRQAQEVAKSRERLQDLKMLEEAVKLGAWRVSEWRLERRHPAEFALKDVNRDNPDDKPAELELPAEVLARHRALMLELAREDEAKHGQKRLCE